MITYESIALIKNANGSIREATRYKGSVLKNTNIGYRSCMSSLHRNIGLIFIKSQLSRHVQTDKPHKTTEN